jgi:hypothetical protein
MNIVRNYPHVRLLLAAALAAGLVFVEIQNSNDIAVAPESGRPAGMPQHCSHDCGSWLPEDDVRAPRPPSATRSLSQYHQQRSSLRAERLPAPEISCRIDPKTGCHYGHKEESHPGGCHCN